MNGMRGIFYFLLLISATVSSLYAQDLFDEDHSLRYTLNLIEHKEYEIAYNELHRMNLDQKTDNDTVKILLLNMCYLTARNTEMMMTADSLSRQHVVSPMLMDHLVGLYLTIDSFELAAALIDRYSLPLTQKAHKYRFIQLLLQDKYTEGQRYFNTHKQEIGDTLFYTELLNRKFTAKTKNKTLAVFLSVVVPASGKYYLGRYYDATVGLTLTALYGILSFRAFSMAGPGSIFGWVNAGAFTAFYVGNIIGTAKAADRYNNTINLTIKSELKNELHTLSGI